MTIVVASATWAWSGTELYVLAFQVEIREPWYATPAFTAAVAAGLFVVLARYVDKWLDQRAEARKEAERRQNDDSSKRLSYSEKMEELTAQQWVEVINRRDALHEQEIDFLHNQLITVDVSKYDLKERLNRAMAELTSVQPYIMKLKTLLIKGGIEFDDIAMRSYGEIMTGVEEKVLAYEESIKDRYAPEKG